MRTTISLDDDIVPVVKQYAARRSVALGKAVSDLVRLGLTVPCATRVVNGITIFDLPDDSPQVMSFALLDVNVLVALVWSGNLPGDSGRLGADCAKSGILAQCGECE